MGTIIIIIILFSSKYSFSVLSTLGNKQKCGIVTRLLQLLLQAAGSSLKTKHQQPTSPGEINFAIDKASQFDTQYILIDIVRKWSASKPKQIMGVNVKSKINAIIKNNRL